MRLLYFLSSVALCASACTKQQENVVHVYSGRHYAVDEQLYEAFTQKTGIQVLVSKGKGDELLQKIDSEGKLCPADLFISTDIAVITQAKNKNLLQKYQDTAIENLIFQDQDHFWVGLSARARVLAVRKDENVDLENYQDLAKPFWKGKVLTRSSENSYNQALMASFVAHWGKDSTLAWAKAVVDNFAREPKGNDRDQLKDLAAKIGDVAIVNTYYVGGMLHSENPQEIEVAKSVRLIFPNQSTTGTHVNISSMAIPQYAPHSEAAKQLIAFLLEKEQQEKIAATNFEFPNVKTAEIPKVMQDWGTFKMDTLGLQTLGNFSRVAVTIFDQAKWQ